MANINNNNNLLYYMFKSRNILLSFFLIVFFSLLGLFFGNIYEGIMIQIYERYPDYCGGIIICHIIGMAIIYLLYSNISKNILALKERIFFPGLFISSQASLFKQFQLWLKSII